METLLLLLLFPLAWPFIAKRIFHKTINWTEMCVQIVLVSFITFCVYEAGKLSQMWDTEIWNGYVVSKDRDHGYYRESYDCYCRNVCSGSGETETCNKVCQTCYKDHYTVTWSADTTLGNIVFQHLDTTSKSVYNAPDPSSYVRCKVGEPAAMERKYINYVQAVPESLFGSHNGMDTYAAYVPPYPRVYDFYRINRVLNVGSKVDNETLKKINDTLNNALKTLGSTKQANIVVILTEIDDQAYRYSVERKWLGGEKNDIVVFVGLDDHTITWVDVMTWAMNRGNEYFQIKLRDAILDMKTFDPDQFSAITISTIETTFDRPQMSDFQYLKDSIKPPSWVLILAIIISIGGSIALSVVFHIFEMEDIIGNFFTSRTRKSKLNPRKRRIR